MNNSNWRWLVLALTTTYLLSIGTAHAACRQALAFGLDVSSSVDAQEYALQMQGLGAALLDPDVQEMLLSDPNTPIHIAIYEWSGRFQQRMIVDWFPVTKTADLLRIAGVLSIQTRGTATRPTAIGYALRFGDQLFARAPDCWQRTLDISGDGKNNDGFSPWKAYQQGMLADVTVNALVISSDEDAAELSSYYRQTVIHGAGSFIEVSLGFEDYRNSMKRKLLREVPLLSSWLIEK